MAKKRRSKIKEIEKTSGLSYELKQRLPVLKFIGGFIIFTILFYLITDADWFDIFRAPLVSVYTFLSSMVLNIFGFGTNSAGPILSSADFSVNVKEGCDAVIPIILYIVAIIVFPAPIKQKLKGLYIGVPLLFALNLFRIVTLFITGIYAPKLFDFMHVEFWQVVFIICTVLIFINYLKKSNQIKASAT